MTLLATVPGRWITAEARRVGLDEIIGYFDDLEGPRDTANRKHPLVSVVVIALVAARAVRQWSIRRAAPKAPEVLAVTADLDQLLTSCGRPLLDLLTYGVYAVRVEPVFVCLAGEYCRGPTAVKALALYDAFCVSGASARLTTCEGESGEVFLAVLYPNSHEAADEGLKVGRKNDWKQADGGPVLGVGRRTFLVGDEGNTVPECREATIT